MSSNDFQRGPFRFDFDPPEDPNFVIADPFQEEPAQLNEAETVKNPEIKPSHVFRVLDYFYGRTDKNHEQEQEQLSKDMPRSGKLNWY